MPAVTIETRCRRSELDESEMIEAVHQALVHAFKIPAQDKGVRLIAHEPHRFACPPTKSQPELFTLITIDAFAGRSVQAKRTLYRSIVDNLEALGIPGDHVTVLLREAPVENWGLRRGQAACDLELGFRIEV